MTIEMNTVMNTEMLIGAGFEKGAAEEETVIQLR